MNIIPRHQVEKLFKKAVYDRGFRYFLEGRVAGLSYNQNNETWFAEVHGSEDYFVEVGVGQLNKGKVSTYCECPAFETYEACKHVVAVMLKMAAREEVKSNNANLVHTQSFLDNLIKGNTSQVDVLSTKLPMQIEYVLKVDYDNSIWLEWRTGIDHRYVVKNIREFLDDVVNHDTHFFTKKFTYHPDEHYFFQQDLDIFRKLSTYIAAGDEYTDRGYFYKNSYDKRSILIPPIDFRSLISLLKERQTTVETPVGNFPEVKVIENEMPYYFSVNQSDSHDFILNVEGKEECLNLVKHQTVFKQGSFYFPSIEQMDLIREIVKGGYHLGELPVAGKAKDQFFSEALPILKKNADVQIDEEVMEGIEEYPLKAKMYLKSKEEMIVGELTYHYGPHEINPFQENRDDSSIILVRESEKEQQIMHLVEESNFHYNGSELYIDLENDEEVYDFLYTILPRLDEFVDLFLTSDIQHFIVETEPIPTTTVSMSGESNLLEIGFDVSGVNDDEVDQLLQAVIEKKRFYRLDSGAIVSLENDVFEDVGRLFHELNVDASEMTDGSIHVPVYQGLHVDELIDRKKYDSQFLELLHALKHPEEQIYPIPSSLNAELRSYQEVGYQWFKSLGSYYLGGILADDMGLGKTLQTITYLLSELGEHPHLVIVPSSVTYNWRNEVERFAPSLNVAVIAGTPAEREQLIRESQDKAIWITSYGTLRQDSELYESLTFSTMILDEAQFIKNYRTKASKAVRSIKANKCFALSGTPIENSIDELWAIFQVILPGLLPSLKEFRKMDPKKISSMTKPFILRRLKTDVLKELPEKIETVHTSELTKEQKELYVGYLRELQDMAASSIAKSNFQQNRMKILAGLTRLRQLCCHPSLFIENYEGRSGKMDELLEQVQTMLNSGRRLLIFSQFTSMHELVIEELKKLGIDYFYLEGKTAAKDRVEMSEAFNQGEKDVFLISLKAGGTGLNLTGADTVILLDLWWNPAVEDQAAGRAHRFGQKNVVQVIRYITEGTIEEKIYELQQKKRELINQVIQPGETMLSSLSEADIKELLNI